MTRPAKHFFRLLCAMQVVAVAPVIAAAGEPGLLHPAAHSFAWTAPGVELQYVLTPAEDNKASQGLLYGVVHAGRSRLRANLRVDPNADARRIAALEMTWELPTSGLLRNVMVGDSYATGAGWSSPARLTGVRFGRPVALRAPLEVGEPAEAAAPAFASSSPLLHSSPLLLSSGHAILPATTGRGLQPNLAAPGASVPIAPVPEDPSPLEGGATDYEVGIGRLREGWDTPDRIYAADFGAAAYRAGLGRGLTAEARTEWTHGLRAHGLELFQQLAQGIALRAVIARSVGTDGNGRRWGLGIARHGEMLAWRVVYSAADRNFRSATGGSEVRDGLRLNTSLHFQKATAELTYLRSTAWDAAVPDSMLEFAANVDLMGPLRVWMHVPVGASAQPEWRAGVSLSVPLDAGRRAPP